MNKNDMVKIDLGCGKRKQSGFIGVDRFPMPEVDIVADIEKRLPFDDDSVDLLFSSHALEHFHDLMAVMKEIYRVCKHGAQVCIVAPYNEQKLNIANPYHVSVFNEHTPRFWTDYPETLIKREDYADPVARPWGLAKSDNSDPEIDIRLINMEFFYFPEYRNLPIEQKRKLRYERFDVCEQIMYQLIVWKENEYTTERSFADYIAAFEPFEPDYIKQIKAREREELIKIISKECDEARLQTADLQSKLAQKEKECDEARLQNADLQSKLAQKENLLADASNSARRVSELETDLDRADRRLADLRTENHQLRMRQLELFEKIEALSDQLNGTKSMLAKSQVEANALKEAMKTKITLLKAELETTNGLLAYYKSKKNDELTGARLNNSHKNEGREIVSELLSQVTAHRASKEARLASIVGRKDMLWKSISPAFSELKLYSAKYFRRSSRARFVLGDDLGSMPYREYKIPYKMDSLSCVSLAIRPLLSASRGVVGIEVISATRQILAQVSLPLSDINPDIPTNFSMPALLPAALEKNWYLRVFVKNVDVPVAVYELVNYSTFRRRAEYLPFVCLR